VTNEHVIHYNGKPGMAAKSTGTHAMGYFSTFNVERSCCGVIGLKLQKMCNGNCQRINR